MWVTYFRNLEKEQSYFQYVCSFLEPVKNANNVSYEIDKISFSQEESLPIKVYNLENQELICYCIENSEVDEFKDLDGKGVYVISKTPKGIWIVKPKPNIPDSQFQFLFYQDSDSPTFSGISRIQFFNFE